MSTSINVIASFANEDAARKIVPRLNKRFDRIVLTQIDTGPAEYSNGFTDAVYAFSGRGFNIDDLVFELNEMPLRYWSENKYFGFEEKLAKENAYGTLFMLRSEYDDHYYIAQFNGEKWEAIRMGRPLR